ncbi:MULTISPECIES: F0F1 ATP synthase subunit B family protein [Streptomyces]|uniref:F0F1 ATP synthase subunit B family protein n=1 Tax=Streptomyces TaxID=1883 RepID=UPI0007C6EEE1|nr:MULTISPECIES: hypothetical protein [Streptomyces]
MLLIPANIGPLNPDVAQLVFGVVVFGGLLPLVGRLLPRIDRVLLDRQAIFDSVEGGTTALFRREAERLEVLTEGLLAEARRDAARTRQKALEEGAALIDSARAEGRRERDEVVVTGQARVEAERAAAEAELRGRVSELASELASRIVGEPVAAPGGTEGTSGAGAPGTEAGPDDSDSEGAAPRTGPAGSGR